MNFDNCSYFACVGEAKSLMEVMLKENNNKPLYDLILTDPPYRLVKGGCTNHAVKLKGSSLEELKRGTVFKENMITFKEWLPLIFKLLKPDKHCYIMCNDRNLKELLIESEKAGFKLLNILVWGKPKHSPNRYYLKNCEFIIFLRKGRAKNINNMGDKQLLLFNNVKNKQHPSEKPVDLMEKLILNSTLIGDTVFDPFMGVGSAGVAALKNKRFFTGIDINEEYVNISIDRFEREVEV